MGPGRGQVYFGFCQAIGNTVGGCLAVLRLLENVTQSSFNGLDFTFYFRQAEVVSMEAYVDDAAGIDGVIGCIENPPLVKSVTVLGLCQLIVGRAGYDVAIELGQGLLIDDGAQGAGRENIAVAAMNLCRRYYFNIGVLSGKILGLVYIDIGDGEPCAGGDQLFSNGEADIAQALQGDMGTGKVSVATAVF